MTRNRPNHVIFDVIIDARGTCHVEPACIEGQRRTLREALAQLPPNSAHQLVLKSRRRSKSQKQLGYYWGYLLPMASEATGYPVEDMHGYFKSKFLNPPDFKTLVIADKTTGEVIDEAYVEDTDTVHKLTTVQMAEYTEDVRNFLAERLQLVTADPDPNWKLNRRMPDRCEVAA